MPTRCWRRESGNSPFWGDTDEGRHILIAVARYLAAHSPTERAALQTADIARRSDAGRRAASKRRGVVTTANTAIDARTLASLRLSNAAPVDGENFDLVVTRQDNMTRGSADQSPRDGGDVRN